MEKNVLVTSRTVPFGKAETVAAWTDPAVLAKWWGPQWFTNVFEKCEIVAWGDWIFTMRWPDGTEYSNVSKWLEVGASRIVIKHACPPHFVLRADFFETPEGTDVVWTTTFEDPEFLAAMKDYLIEKNGENFDRLEAVLAQARNGNAELAKRVDALEASK